MPFVLAPSLQSMTSVLTVVIDQPVISRHQNFRSRTVDSRSEKSDKLYHFPQPPINDRMPVATPVGSGVYVLATYGKLGYPGKSACHMERTVVPACCPCDCVTLGYALFCSVTHLNFTTSTCPKRPQLQGYHTIAAHRRERYSCAELP